MEKKTEWTMKRVVLRQVHRDKRCQNYHSGSVWVAVRGGNSMSSASEEGQSAKLWECQSETCHHDRLERSSMGGFEGSYA